MDKKLWYKIFRENKLNEFEREMFPPNTIKKIKDLVNHNAHTEAYVEIARVIGDKKLTSDLEKVQDEHERAGHLSQEIKTKRDKLYKKMLSLAKARFINYNDMYKSL
jgi:hypothetical protein